MTVQDQSQDVCRTHHDMAENILAIDIGGSGLKATVLDPEGNMLCERVRTDTPIGAHPDAMVAMIKELVRDLPPSTRIAAGFPGMVRKGIVRTAPNLGHDGWRDYDLAAAFQRELGKPSLIRNDADVQGLAVISGEGVEMVITLGTGFGTALYDEGRLCPHLEISHQPFRKNESYDQHLGNFARKSVGNKKWNRRVLMAIDNMRALTHFDHLYVGGGNAKKLFVEFPADVTVVDNAAGLRGGAKLWERHLAQPN